METAREQHRNYHLVTGYDDDRTLDGMRLWTRAMSDRDGKCGSEAFTEAIEVSRTALAMLGFEGSGSPTALLNETLSRAKARIDLGSFDTGQRYVKRISSEDINKPKPQVPSAKVRWAILTSLLNIRRACPERFRLERLEVDGLCSLLDIEKDVYVFNAGVLEEKGWIAESDYDQVSLAAGGAYITAKGIDALECADGETSEY